jgi:pyruvate dehydrogenase kinase 2/3/4
VLLKLFTGTSCDHSRSYVGIICSKTSPYEIVKRAIDDAAFMCTRKYGDAPEVIITGRLDM